MPPSLTYPFLRHSSPYATQPFMHSSLTTALLPAWLEAMGRSAAKRVVGGWESRGVFGELPGNWVMASGQAAFYDAATPPPTAMHIPALLPSACLSAVN